MEDLLLGALVSIIGAAVAFLGHRIIDSVYKNRTKEISAKFENGKSESITVPSGATAEEISQEIHSLLAYENHILNLLKFEIGKEQLSSIHEGNDFDLVINNLGKKYAIEVKNNLKAESLKQLKKYIANDKNIEKAFVISRTPISKKTLDIARGFMASGKVQFLEIPSPDEGQEKITEIVNGIRSST